MDFSKGLALKGLGALGASAAAATGLNLGFGDPLGLFSGYDSASTGFASFESIKDSLGLGECQLTEGEGKKECAFTNESIKTINFDGKGEGNLTVENSESVTLTIEETKGDRGFENNLKFIFKNNGETEAKIKKGETTLFTLKKGLGLEFKIKKTEGDKLSLEKAWTANSLAEKVGMKSCDGGECTFGSKINLSDWNGKTDNISTTDKSKKITFEENQADYNQGIKFIVKEEITLGSKKLSPDSTYEIKKLDGGKWYLVKKTPTKREEEIKTLGLPVNCNLPTNDSPQTCSGLSSDDLKAINFDNKSNGAINANNVNLKIEKTSDKTFPEGYKFTLITTDDISSPISLKKNTNTEFKIKKNGDGVWSLERAWTVTELAKKVGLNCTEGDENSCTVGSNFNVYVSSDKKLTNAKSSSNPKGKIKFEKEIGEYNQGFKFFIDGGDINFTNSNDSVKRLEKYETYEIKEQTEGNGKKWYFSRKDSAVNAKNNKLTSLGLPTGCKFEESSDEKDCGTLTDDTLKEINFEGKKKKPQTITGTSSNVTLKIRKDGNENFFPDGIKIIFENNGEIKSTELNIDWKSETNPEYKIKEKENGGGSKIERALTFDKLIKRLNLNCPNSGSGDATECTFGDSINIFEDNSNNIVDAPITDKENKKLKVEKDQAGYNQGFKFKIKDDSENIEVNKGGKTITLEKNTSYEIKEQVVEGKKHWFLSKVNSTVQR